VYASAVSQLQYSLQRGLAAKAGAGSAAAAYFAGSLNGVPPNVSFPGFNLLAYYLNIIAQVRGIAWLPYVTPAQLLGFEAYANATLGSQWAGVTAVQAGYANDTAEAAGILKTSNNVHGGVFAGNASYHVPVNASAAYYFPLIQESPLQSNEAVIMYDLNSEPVRNAAITAALGDGQQHTTDLIRLVQDTNANILRVASLLITPVIVNGTTIGLSNTVFNWDTVLAQALPGDISGIDVVLGSGLSSKQFTMRVVGGNVLGIGFGDLHDTTPTLQPYARVVSATLGTTWTMTLYPTTELIASYHTSGPRDRCVAVVVVIVVCLILFYVHDMLARSRSEVLLRFARATSRLVDDAFPKQLRARVVRQALDDLANEGSHRGVGPSIGGAPQMSQGAARALVAIQRWVGLEAAQERAVARLSSRFAAASDLAVADTFPSVTVIFCDIVGFTAWSASVPPEIVFRFLGSLFSSFDVLADTRGLYKMETVGDCWMGVAGLPEQTPQHASRVADFALALPSLLAKVCADMGVAQLALRIGAHSGPVTAGVLLGARARFQLFGDTVNTASRMESTGLPGRVQVSSATAQLLREQFDLELRGKVNAKGLGEVSTYWLNRRSSGEPYTQAGNRRGRGYSFAGSISGGSRAPSYSARDSSGSFGGSTRAPAGMTTNPLATGGVPTSARAGETSMTSSAGGGRASIMDVGRMSSLDPEHFDNALVEEVEEGGRGSLDAV